MTLVLGIDPGGTTGFAQLDLESNTWHLSELGPEEHHRDLYWRLIRLQPDTIICESFDYRVVESKGTKMPGINLISREYIGIVKLYTEVYPTATLIMQSPAQGGGGSKHSGFWKNDKLKKVGLYSAPGGRQHMNDATRHVLYWLTFTRKDNRYLAMLR